jgi:uncharacterized protein YdcH (DUF465 family)
MTHVPHELHEEFPEDAAILHELKLSDTHFQKLSDAYHEVNRTIHRADTDVEPASDVRLEELKKQRLALLDDISVIVAGARA